MNPEDLLIGTGESVERAFRSFLGVGREAFVCPECSAPCDETFTHDPQRAAFDGGESPAWYCDKCDSHYVRERDDGDHTMDLYGRGPPE